MYINILEYLYIMSFDLLVFDWLIVVVKYFQRFTYVLQPSSSRNIPQYVNLTGSYYYNLDLAVYSLDQNSHYGISFTLY